MLNTCIVIHKEKLIKTKPLLELYCQVIFFYLHFYHDIPETRELNATFGTSLLLANSPMSPKIVNGTHVAICDYEQVLSSCAQTFAQLKMEPKDSPGKNGIP